LSGTSTTGSATKAIDYAMRLNQAGVPAELHVHPGAPHGVKRFAGVPVAQRYTRGINDWIGRQPHGPAVTAGDLARLDQILARLIPADRGPAGSPR